eukprot:scaffold5772_cov188-Amphora_coffeaeformis.AAC.11
MARREIGLVKCFTEVPIYEENDGRFSSDGYVALRGPAAKMGGRLCNKMKAINNDQPTGWITYIFQPTSYVFKQ